MGKIQSSIAPWLTVRNSVKAVEFYKSAFGALEVYRLEGSGWRSGGKTFC